MAPGESSGGRFHAVGRHRWRIADPGASTSEGFNLSSRIARTEPLGLGHEMGTRRVYGCPFRAMKPRLNESPSEFVSFSKP
jgi:hypothetical protein